MDDTNVNLACFGMLVYALEQASKNGNEDAKDIINRMKDAKEKDISWVN